MELRLNIYNGRNIEKIYTSEDFVLMTGTCEDILKLVDVDKISGNLDDDSAITEVLKLVIRAFDEFKPMMQQIFEGLTEDEYRRTNVAEVAGIVAKVVQYTFTQLVNSIASKN